MTPRQIEYLQLVTRHQAAILGYIRSIAPGAPAEDILQEVNLVLWSKADHFEPGGHFKAFAFRIAHLKTLEALRADKRRRWLVFDSDLLEAIARRHEDADDRRSDDHAQRALRECMTALDPADRELLHRRYTRRETVRDISRDDTRSEGALQQVFFRLRAQLRTCIERRIAMEGGNA